MSTHYINVGSPKACFWCHMSKQLLNILGRYPLMYDAIEEGVLCAQQGYYVAGILAFSQLLNQFNCESPSERHGVAHEFLQHPPTKLAYDNLVIRVKEVAQQQYDREQGRKSDPDLYRAEINEKWYELFGHGIENGPSLQDVLDLAKE